jgi:TPR repeat protein
MTKPANKPDIGKSVQGPSGRQKLVGLLAVVAILVALATAVGISFAPKTSVQADAETVAIQEGLTAFKAGAFSSALEKLKPAAAKGNAQAAYWLGRMYEDGLGVKKNADAAITWFRKAAEGGWPDAELRLGEIYFNGTEDLQDFEKARKWLEQAAHRGDARAQLDLGRLYANGWGGDKDSIQAYVWYEFAAKQGNYEAQRLRDALLKAMQENEIAEAQQLTEKMAPEVFNQGKNETKDGKAQSAANTK